MGADRGYVGDQRWLDLVPGMFDGVRVVRHPGWNVGRWNLDGRPLTSVNGEWRVGGEPLVFFHFSGLLSGADSPAQQRNLEVGASSAAVQSLIDDYAKALDRHGATSFARLPFAFSRSRAAIRTESLYKLKASGRHLLHAVTTSRFRRRVRHWLRNRASR